MSFPRLLSLFVLAALFLGQTPQTASAQTAAAYIIVDNASGHVLDSSNAQKKLQIASLTKLATAMVVLDWAEARGQDLSQLATVPDAAGAIPTVGNAVPLNAGDQCSLKDLLYAALLQSDNRAALTLANHVGRALGEGDPVTSFVQQMNALGRKVGMKNTRFLNPHGLDESEKKPPYSTAEDLAELTRYAMDRPALRFYVSQTERRITIVTAGGSQGFNLKNTNELLGVENIDGVKTGTTRTAGQCVIISAARPPESRQEGEKHFITPRRVTVVLLGAADRFGTARALLAKGWQLHDAWVAAGHPGSAAPKAAPKKRSLNPFATQQ